MTQFHEQSCAAREGTLGDTAEAIFEETYPLKWVRYGLNRPPLKMSSLSELVRTTPDYLTSDGFVEVKGLGRDQRLKIKQSSLTAMKHWDLMMPLRIFIWDSHKKRSTTVPLNFIEQLINTPDACTHDWFDQNTSSPKAYWGVPADLIFQGAEE